MPLVVKRNKGHVVTIASLASYAALPACVEYSATKAGALAFHEGLTCEIKNLYKAPGVMTTAVHPNFVKTAMTTPYAEMIEKSTGSMLAVEDISGPVVAQILSRRGGHIIVPERMSFFSSIRGWPSWAQELLRDQLAKER